MTYAIGTTTPANGTVTVNTDAHSVIRLIQTL
ncbi:hypothetical protein [Chitinophaga pinensis]